MAHIGERHNYLGPLGLKISLWLKPPLFRMFFNDIPETRLLFDLDSMIQEALDFDYREIPETLMKKPGCLVILSQASKLNWRPQFFRAGMG